MEDFKPFNLTIPVGECHYCFDTNEKYVVLQKIYNWFLVLDLFFIFGAWKISFQWIKFNYVLLFFKQYMNNFIWKACTSYYFSNNNFDCFIVLKTIRFLLIKTWMKYYN